MLEIKKTKQERLLKKIYIQQYISYMALLLGEVINIEKIYK